MTKQEADRIDALYQAVIEWRREDSNRLLSLKNEIIAATKTAVDTHAIDCRADHLGPMCEKVDWLYDNAQRRCAEVRLRRRWQKLTLTLLGALCTAIGVATPYILHLL